MTGSPQSITRATEIYWILSTMPIEKEILTGVSSYRLHVCAPYVLFSVSVGCLIKGVQYKLYLGMRTLGTLHIEPNPIPKNSPAHSKFGGTHAYLGHGTAIHVNLSLEPHGIRPHLCSLDVMRRHDHGILLARERWYACCCSRYIARCRLANRSM
jgi:hypothetical protein